MTPEPSSGGENFNGVIAPEPLLPVLGGDFPGAGGDIIVHPPPSLVGLDGNEINIPPVFSVDSMRANSPVDGRELAHHCSSHYVPLCTLLLFRGFYHILHYSRTIVAGNCHDLSCYCH
ncbi:hypothetical protein K439DRAFT_1622736 [Ramaria rubella]|nr:hypothetical protein K439DRAFT_1622736 [Ramaria rubella]